MCHFRHWIHISVTAWTGFPLSSTVSFGLYQVWLMSGGDRFPSAAHQTQQEQRDICYTETHDINQRLKHAHRVQSLTQNTHASLQAHCYTNNTCRRRANTNTYTNTQSDGQGPSWFLTTDSRCRLIHQSFWVTGQSLRPIFYHLTDIKKLPCVGA